MSPRVRAALAFVAGAALLGALVWYVGPAQVVEAVKEASPAYLALAFLTYAAFFVVRGIRWRVLFSSSAPDVRLSSTTGLTAVGWLANSILPLKGGDVLRAALISKREKVALATSASSIGLERVLDLLGIALVAALGLALLPTAGWPAGLVLAMEIAWILPLVAIAVLAVLVRFRVQTVAVAARMLRPFGKVGQNLLHFGETVLAGLDALSRRPALLLKLAPLTVVAAILQPLIFAFLVMAFIPGTGFVPAFAGSAIFLLSFVVSVTPGNVGTYEAAFAAVFVAIGVPAEVALPAGILTHLATTLIVALLGSAALLALGVESDKLSWRPTRVPTQGGMP